MRDFLKQLNEIGFTSLATISDNKVHSRTFAIAAISDDGKIFFLTSSEKKVYEQLAANKFVALNTFVDGKEEYRMEGVVNFISDPGELLDQNEHSKKKYVDKLDVVRAFYVELTFATKLTYTENGPELRKVK